MADETNTAAPKTYSQEEYTKLDERSKRFEAQAVDLQKRLERFAGIDPDEHKAMREDYENLRKENVGSDKGRLEQLLADKEAEAQKRYGKKISELEEANEHKTRELKTLRVTNVAMQKAAGLFTDDSLKFIEREVENDCEWSGDTIVIKGENGKPRPSNKDPRLNMTIEEYLEGLAAEHPSIAKSNASGGGMRAGSTKPAASSGNVGLEKYVSMTKEERAKLPIKDRIELSKQALSHISFK